MRNKLVTLSLILALVFAPANRTKAEPKPDSVLVGCVVLIVGAVIIYGIWKMCKRLEKLIPCPPPPPGTNCPSGSNHMAAVMASPARLNNNDVYLDNAGPWQMFVATFQRANGAGPWMDAYTVTNWLSSTQLVSVCASNGVPVMTNFQALYWTNENVLVDLTGILPDKVTEPSQMWRSVQTP